VLTTHTPCRAEVKGRVEVQLYSPCSRVNCTFTTHTDQHCNTLRHYHVLPNFHSVIPQLSYSSRDSLASLVTWLRSGRSLARISSRARDFSLIHTNQTESATQQSYYWRVTLFFLGGKRYLVVRLTIHFHLASRLRMKGVKLYSPHAFTEWTGATTPLPNYPNIDMRRNPIQSIVYLKFTTIESLM